MLYVMTVCPSCRPIAERKYTSGIANDKRRSNLLGNYARSSINVQRLPCRREHNTLHSGITCQSLRRRRAFGELNEDVQELSECRLAVCIPQPDRQNHIYLRATDPAVPTSALQLGESTEGISCTQRRLGFAMTHHMFLP